MDESKFDMSSISKVLSLNKMMEDSRNTINESANNSALSYRNNMNESTFDSINETIKSYRNFAEEMFYNYERQQAANHFCANELFSKHDSLKLMSKLDCYRKENPDNYKIYFNRFLDKLNDCLQRLNEPRVPFGIGEIRKFDSEEARMADIVLGCISDAIQHIKELLKPETETQEPPQKFVKLKPIEKLLIIDYLKIDSLKRCQLGQKPGVFFLSRLLDINPESIKKPLLKLNDYTTIELTDSQAANIYPTLEKVKLFFDESELNEISKVIQIRINVLKRQLGKD